MPGFGPFGSVPFGASSDGEVGNYYYDNLTTAFALRGVIDRSFFMLANDASNASTTILGIDVPSLLEHVALNGSASTFLAAQSSLTQGITFDDSLQIAWAMLLGENLQLVADAAGNPILLGAMIDTMHATGMAETRLDALAAVAGALAMEAMIQQGWSVNAVDSATFNDALQAAAKFIAPLVDAAGLAGTATHAMRLIAVGADSAHLLGEAEASAVLQADAADGILLYATLSIGGEEYAGWVMNTTTRGMSEYRQFPYESVCFWRGRTFLAGRGGVFEQVGDDDAGDPIEAFVRSGLVDFGTGREKQVPDVYYATNATGAVVIKVVTTDPNGVLVEDWYASVNQTPADYREGRFKVGRGLKTRYLQFELHNVAGGRLDFVGLEWHPLLLDRRVKGK